MRMMKKEHNECCLEVHVYNLRNKPMLPLPDFDKWLEDSGIMEDE